MAGSATKLMMYRGWPDRKPGGRKEECFKHDDVVPPYSIARSAPASAHVFRCARLDGGGGLAALIALKALSVVCFEKGSRSNETSVQHTKEPFLSFFQPTNWLKLPLHRQKRDESLKKIPRTLSTPTNTIQLNQLSSSSPPAPCPSSPPTS